MRPGSDVHGLLIVACLVAGCQGSPMRLTAPRPAPAASVAPVVPAAKTPVTPAPAAAGLVSEHGAGIVTDHGSGIISDNASSLSGIAVAPASLISDLGSGLVTDHGSGLVTDHGSGLVTDHGSGYRLQAAVQEVPLPNQTVRLLDATGQPVLGTDGKPLTALTDANGKYAFTVPLPAKNLVVSIDLGGKGAVQAVAVKSDQPRHADLDLASTLTTGYILDEYVATQQDRQQCFDRLTGQAEADTLAKAQSAIDGGTAAVPAALTNELVDATVATLRAKDTGFDQQMEAVRKLLIVAGQSDQGNGRPALEIGFGSTNQLLVASDGSLYIDDDNDERIWRVGPDGKAVVVAGNASTSENDDSSLEGKPGASTPTGFPQWMTFDSAGELVFSAFYLVNDPTAPGGKRDRSRVLRVGPDGVLHELWPSHRYLAGMAMGPTGRLYVVTASQYTGTAAQNTFQPSELWAIDPDATVHQLHTFTDQETHDIFEQTLYGYSALDPQGNMVFAARTGSGQVFRLDPTTFKVAPADIPGPTSTAQHLLAPGANFFMLDSTSHDLSVLRPDGSVLPLAKGLAKDFVLTGAVLAPDGSAYIDNWAQRQVIRVKDGQLSVVAGLGQTVAGSLSDLVLKQPGAVLAGRNGDLYVADQVTTFGYKVLHIAADKQVTTVAGTGVPGQIAGDGGPATQAVFNQPTQLAQDHAGDLVVVDSGEIRKIDQAGNIAPWLPPADPGGIANFGALAIAFGPDDTLYWLQPLPDTSLTMDRALYHHEGVMALAPGAQKPTKLLDMGVTSGVFCMGIDPAGALYLAGEGQLQRWTAKDGWTTVKSDPLLTFTTYGGPIRYVDNRVLTFDAGGRFYVPHEAVGTLERYDPAKGAFEVIAGPGGRFFSGTGVDDGVKNAGVPVFDAHGNLVFSDGLHGQIKRIPAGELQ